MVHIKDHLLLIKNIDYVIAEADFLSHRVVLYHISDAIINYVECVVK